MDPLNMHEWVATAEEREEETWAEVPVAMSWIGTKTAHTVSVVLFDPREPPRTVSGEDLEPIPSACKTPCDLRHVGFDAADVRLRAVCDHRDQLGRHHLTLARHDPAFKEARSLDQAEPLE